MDAVTLVCFEKCCQRQAHTTELVVFPVKGLFKWKAGFVLITVDEDYALSETALDSLKSYPFLHGYLKTPNKSQCQQ